MTIKGESARQIGLVEEFVDDANVEALALAKIISSNSRTSVAGIKQILAGAADGEQLFEDELCCADSTEVLAAFTSTRTARFTHLWSHTRQEPTVITGRWASGAEQPRP